MRRAGHQNAVVTVTIVALELSSRLHAATRLFTLAAEPTPRTRQLQRETAVPNPTVPAEIISRIRSEYHEMPGLKLTPRQAQRLWALDRNMCERLLALLLSERFLKKTADGAFVRA